MANQTQESTLLTLAIETSSKSVSVALLDGAKPILELDSRKDTNQSEAEHPRLSAGSGDELPPGFVRKRDKGSPKTGKTKSSRIFPPGASVLLAPMMKDLLQQTERSFKDVKLVAVSVGPGSFTGLRVGVVAAKAIAYSNGAEIVAVNSLEAIAAQTANEMLSSDSSISLNRIRPVVNAQRQQLFVSTFRYLEPWKVEPIATARTKSEQEVKLTQIIDRESWIAENKSGDILTGPGVKPLVSQVELKNPESIIAPESSWLCSATTIGRLANLKFQSGTRDSLWELEPLYFRPSSAEEIAIAKAKQ